MIAWIQVSKTQVAIVLIGGVIAIDPGESSAG